LLIFADFEIDTDRYELRRSGQPVSVEPMVFNLLLHFARHANTLFSSDDLMAAVWGRPGCRGLIALVGAAGRILQMNQAQGAARRTVTGCYGYSRIRVIKALGPWMP
jgi:hypothetical protein